MKKLLQALLFIGLLAVVPTVHADAIVTPVASATTAGASGIASGVSALATGTWMVAKGVTGILWAVTKGLYHGGAAVGRGIGHLVHSSPKQPAPELPQS